MCEKIKKWYLLGLWTESMVRHAVSKGLITKEAAESIFEEAVQ